jgi:hypothetical protein
MLYQSTPSRTYLLSPAGILLVDSMMDLTPGALIFKTFSYIQLYGFQMGWV